MTEKMKMKERETFWHDLLLQLLWKSRIGRKDDLIRQTKNSNPRSCYLRIRIPEERLIREDRAGGHYGSTGVARVLGMLSVLR